MDKKAPGILVYPQESGAQTQFIAPVLSAKCLLLGAGQVPKNSVLAKSARSGLGTKMDLAACSVRGTYLAGSSLNKTLLDSSQFFAAYNPGLQ